MKIDRGSVLVKFNVDWTIVKNEKLKTRDFYRVV